MDMVSERLGKKAKAADRRFRIRDKDLCWD
jgi:hypothetical protein